jgi:AraC-like DNA-binding protein
VVRRITQCQDSFDKSPDAHGVQASLGELLTLLFVHCVERRAVAAAAPRAHVVRVRDYLEANYHQQFRMCDLSAAVGMSRYHLTRTFSAEFGVTPHVYVLQLRLAKAKSLLATSLPVRHVAVETGFADQSHFTRHFRNTYGVTPVQYLRAIRNT